MKICACENCLKVVGECCLPSCIEMIIKLILIIKCRLYDLCNNSSQNVINIEPLLPFHACALALHSVLCLENKSSSDQTFTG